MQNHGQPKNSNNALDLAEKMKQQMDEQAQSSKLIIQEGLKSLSSELQKSAKHELSIIENVIKKDSLRIRSLQEHLIQNMQTSLKVPIITSIVITITGCLTLIGGTMLWINFQQANLTELSQKVQKQKKIEKKLVSWGVTPLQENNRRFIVLPVGTKTNQTWQSGNRPAILLED